MRDVSAQRLSIEVAIHTDGDASTGEICVVGDFDRSQVAHFDRIVEALSTELVHVTVDLSGADIIDSAALGGLIRLRSRLEQRSCSISTVVSKPFQIKTMEIGGLVDHLAVVVRH